MHDEQRQGGRQFGLRLGSQRPATVVVGSGVVLLLVVGLVLTLTGVGAGSGRGSAARPEVAPTLVAAPSAFVTGGRVPASVGATPPTSTPSSTSRSSASPSATTVPATTGPAAAPGRAGSAAALPGPIRDTTVLPAVAPLRTLHAPDALIALPASITPAESEALRAIPGLVAFDEMDLGTVSVAGHPTVIAGVIPGDFRQFTPQVTGTDDELWRYLGAGAVVAAYDSAPPRGLVPGRPVTIVPTPARAAAATGWLGGVASLGLPGIDLVVSHSEADRLGLLSDGGVVVSAPSVAPAALRAELTAALPGAEIEVLKA